MKRLLAVLLVTLAGSPMLRGQSPAGVDGCELWLLATPTGSSPNGPFVLADRSGDNAAVTRNGQPMASQPRDSVQTFNLHPAVTLPSTGSPLSVQFQSACLPQVTVMGVYAPSLPSVNDTVCHLWSILGSDTLTRMKCWGGDTARSVRIHTWQRAQPPGHSIWRERMRSNLSLGGAGTYKGWCPELLVWGRVLTPYERRRAETYLALKYGISLDGSYYVGDRLAWDHDPAWHRVTGVFADGSGTLLQNLSATSYEEAPRYTCLPANDSHHQRDCGQGFSASRLLAMGTSVNGISGAGHLIWGDDGAATTTMAAGGHWHAMQRRWLVSEAGGLGSSALAELSYSIAGGGEFRPYRHGRTFLLASGQDSSNAFRCAGFDAERSKILFNGVSLEDGDTVTFAWNDGLVANVSAEEATCSGTTPCSDGLIITGITCGGPVTAFTLSTMAGIPLRTGFLTLGNDTIGDLSPGTYLLTLCQPQSHNIHSEEPDETETLTGGSLSTVHELAWQHGDLTSDYSAGLVIAGSSGGTYGFRVSNGQAVVTVNGNEIPHYTRSLSPGTQFRLSRSGSSVSLYIDGESMSTLSFAGIPVFRATFSGESQLCNATGIPSAVCSSDRVSIEYSAADTLRYEVHLGSSCGGDTYIVPLDNGDDLVYHSPGSLPEGNEPSDGKLKTHSVPSNPLGFTAVLPPGKTDGPVQFLVFDASGRLHREGRILSTPPFSETFSVRSPGVYIVKALTAGGEHTCKVACGTP